MQNTNKWLIAVSVFTGALMSTIDTFILYIATPHLRGIFSATTAEISWLSTSYSVAALVSMLLSGWLCGRFGRKRVYQYGLVIFILSSVLCGLSSSLTFLIFARILQGIGAGILVPVENVILRRTFPPEEHGTVIGIYGTTVMIGPALGPVLGGLIIDNLHWSFIFLVNVPIGLIGFIMVQKFVPVDKPNKENAATPYDWLGVTYLVIGLFCLVWLLERGDRLYWFDTFSNIIILFVSLSSLAMFCAHEMVTKNPAVDISVLRNKVFSTTVMLNFMLGFVVTATLFILPLYMQDVLRFTPTKAGETLAPRALFMMLVFPCVGFLFSRINPRILICGGLTIGLVSALMMSRFTHDTGWHDMLIPQILQGVAVVLVLVPLTTIGLKSVLKEQLATAAGFDSMSRQIGGTIGVAVFATLLTHFELKYWGVLRHDVSLAFTVFYKRFNGVIDFFLLKGSSKPIAMEQSALLLNSRVQEQVLVISYMNLFNIISVIFFGMLTVAACMKLRQNG